jgi:hydroxymethylpyrimidine pyrophosphatase-like HAD family hydrolase
MSATAPTRPAFQSVVGFGRIRALALDYDGTIADCGRVAPATAASLRRLSEAGIRLILVSGRRLENIRAVCDVLELFDAVILENGAVSWCPRRDLETLLAKPVSDDFLALITRELPGEPVFVGKVMIAMPSGNAPRLKELISMSGYDLAVIGCGERMIVLPAGVSKQSGLDHALMQLGLHREDIAAVGDEENDLDLFRGAGLTFAVGNAAPDLKAAADMVLPGHGGEAICWLADRLLEGKV